MLDWPITSGAGRVLLLAMGVVALTLLLARRDAQWWRWTVPRALGVGVVVSVALVVVVDQVWRPFPDPLPTVTVLWTGLTAAALVLAVRRPRWRRRAVALLAVVVVGLSGAAQVNQTFQAYPTLRTALGLPPVNQVAFSQVPGRTDQLVRAAPGAPLTSAWTPPAGMPDAGVVTTASIPGTTSGFATRPAWLYLPPAYLSTPRAQLPVLVLVPGQPGAPRDWFDGGKLAQVMDTFAASHSGLAPVVVVADPLGSRLAQPLCVDGRNGNAFSYLTVDVPGWITATLQVDPDPRHWAVGGISAGGTCALQLAVNAPAVYPTFLDLSGQDEPTVGTRAQTVATVFGGDAAAFARVNPLDVLVTRRFPDTAGVVVAGRDDGMYRPQAQTVFAATQAAGMDVRYIELPGGHSWQVWGAGFTQSLPWLATRTGLAP